MIYVALLRGINVGGNRKVEMKLLKESFEQAGMRSVKTYINSGNVIFETNESDQVSLADNLEKVIEEKFSFQVKVLLRDIKDMKSVVEALPSEWTNDKSMKCDVLFLWEAMDDAAVLETLIIKEGIDRVKYVPGCIIWSVDRPLVTRSGMMKLVGTDLYRQMTVRNCNTTRKLYDIMKGL